MEQVRLESRVFAAVVGADESRTEFRTGFQTTNYEIIARFSSHPRKQSHIYRATTPPRVHHVQFSYPEKTRCLGARVAINHRVIILTLNARGRGRRCERNAHRAILIVARGLTRCSNDALLLANIENTLLNSGTDRGTFSACLFLREGRRVAKRAECGFAAK